MYNFFKSEKKYLQNKAAEKRLNEYFEEKYQESLKRKSFDELDEIAPKYEAKKEVKEDTRTREEFLLEYLLKNKAHFDEHRNDKTYYNMRD